MWTCDVWSKLTDFNIFNSPSGIFFALNSRTSADLPLEDISKVTFASAFSDRSEFEQKFGYLQELMDTLEPLRLRARLYRREMLEVSFYTYAHSIVRWKEAILYMVPEMERVIAFFESRFRYHYLNVCKLCDHMYKSAQKGLALIWTVLILDEVQYLRGSEILEPEPLLAESTIPALESRLKVLCTQIFDFDPPEKPTRELKNQDLAMFLDHQTTASSFLPSHYHSPQSSIIYIIRTVRNELPPPGTTVQWDSPPCLLSRANGNTSGYDTLQMDHCGDICCCGWMFDSLPSGLLSFFDLSAKSFAHHFHAKEWTVDFAGEKPAFEAHHIMHVMFDSTDVEQMILQKEMAIVNLRKKMSIFRQACKVSLQHFFIGIRILKQLSTTMKLSEAQIKVQVEDYRQIMLFYILKTAVLIYYAYFKANGKSETGAESVQDLVAEFIYWQDISPEVKEHTKFLLKLMCKLHLLRLDLVAGMSRND